MQYPPRVEITCSHCEKVFNVRAGRASAKFCSAQCSHLGQRRRGATEWSEKRRAAVAVKECAQCGATFTATAGGKKYCSSSCRARAARSRTPVHVSPVQIGHAAWKNERAVKLAAQGGRCAICDRELEVGHLDHDHATGATRGVLCSPCNTGLGMLQEDVERMRRAINYLEEHRG